MASDERLRFNRSTPEADGLARMARDVGGRRARVVSLRRLKGGLDASTHAIRIEPGGWLVLKRSPDTDPRFVRGEFERLGRASSAEVATPEPIALDADGAWFGRPAFVMSRVPGRSVVHRDRGPWVDDLAQALATIHATRLPATAKLPAVLHEPHAGIAWRPATAKQLRSTPLVQRLQAVGVALQQAIEREPPPAVLLHHDFHHGNVTWRTGRLAAVVDWNEARLGPRESDVGYCSVDLAMTHGRATAEAFCRAYQSAAGLELGRLRQWQALWIASDMRWIAYWISSFQDAGAEHLTLPVLRRHLRGYADFVLAQLGPGQDWRPAS